MRGKRFENINFLTNKRGRMFKKRFYGQWHLVLRSSEAAVTVFRSSVVSFQSLESRPLQSESWRMLGVMSYQGKPSVAFLFVSYPG